MKSKIKGLLALVLSVLIGQAWAANPVATWTDFNTLTSGEYTLTKDESCTVNTDGSITLGGAGLTLPVSGNQVTVVMEVSGVPTESGITVVSVMMGGQYVSLKSNGTQLIQSWNNDGDYGTFNWTPANRQTIVLGTMQSNPSGTTTWIDGVQKVTRANLMTTVGSLGNVYIGSYNGTATDGTITGSAAGMIVHSLRLYSTKLSDDEVVSDIIANGGTVAAPVVINRDETLETSRNLNFTNGSNAINAGGTLKVVSGEVTFNGNGSVNGTVDISEGATFVATNEIFGSSGAVTGAGKLVVNGYPNASIRTSLGEETWTGTYVNTANNTLQDNSNWLGAVGNTNSIVEFTGSSTGYLMKAGSMNAALKVTGSITFNNGFSTGGGYTFNGELLGTGTLATSGSPTDVLKFLGETKDFAGTITVDGGHCIAFGEQADDDSKCGMLVIKADKTANIAAGKTWTAVNGIEVAGTIGGEGTIGSTLILLNGATLANAMTLEGNVTVAEGTDINHAYATAVGDTVITCANADAVAAALTGAPEGLKYVAENGVVKLAAAQVTVTIPAAPANTKWYDANGNEVSGSVIVDPNTDVTLTLKADEGYVFADGSTQTTVTVNSGNGAAVTAPDVTAATPVAQVVGGKQYQTLADAIAAAEAGAKIQLLADIELTTYVSITKSLTLDLGAYTITRMPVSASSAAVLYINSADAEVTIMATTGGITGPQAVWANAGTVTIEGGVFAGLDGEAAYVKNTGKIIIMGGTFSASGDVTYVINQYDADRETSSISVMGGKFYNFNPANNGAEGEGTNFCAEGYTAVAGEGEDEGYYVVVEDTPAVAQIGETPYETLQAACNDANEGDIVVLIADTEENCVVKEGFNGTIDLGGKTLTGRIFSKSATMTIQNGTIVRKWIGDDKSSSNGAIEIQGGSLTLQDTLSVQILADNVTHLIRLRNSASCVINGGNYSITSTGTDATILYPSAAGTTMTVNGGTFTYDTTNASMPSIANIYGTLTVNGGTFNANGRSYLFNIDSDGGKTYVNNGLFNCSSSGRLTYNNPKEGDPYGYLEFLGGKYGCNPKSSRGVIAEGYASGLLEDNYYIVSKAYDVALTVETAKASVDGLNEVHACGSIVSFTVTALEGFKVTGVTLDGAALIADANGKYTFTMPEKDVAIVVTTEAASTFDVTIGGTLYADADALKAAANSTTTMTVPEGTWSGEGNVLMKDGAAYVEFADYYTVVVNGTSVTLKLNKPVIGESAEGADDAFTVTADAVTIKITNYNSTLKYGVRTAGDINSLKTAEITEVETEDGVITLTKSGDSAFFEVIVSDVDFPTMPAE